MSDDDLTPYADSPVVAALRAPAQPHELAGEQVALAMFRDSARRGSRGRHLRRVGVAGAGVVLSLALTGGVAAAYTTGLPDPVQNVLHSAIEPLGLPAPPSGEALRLKRIRRALHRAGLPGPPLLRHQPTPAALPTAGPQPASPASSPRPRPSAAAPAPAQPPASLSSTLSRSTIPVHGSVVLSGRLTRNSTGLSGKTVYAAEQVPGSSWHRIADARTGSDGSVSFTVSPSSNAKLRLVSESGVVSRAVPVAVVPRLSIRITRSQGKRIATVTADGGRPADTLVLLRRDARGWTRVATTSVSAGSFTVPGPGPSRVHYRVRLAATRLHTASYADFYVAAR